MRFAVESLLETCSSSFERCDNVLCRQRRRNSSARSKATTATLYDVRKRTLGKDSLESKRDQRERERKVQKRPLQNRLFLKRRPPHRRRGRPVQVRAGSRLRGRALTGVSLHIFGIKTLELYLKIPESGTRQRTRLATHAREWRGRLRATRSGAALAPRRPAPPGRAPLARTRGVPFFFSRGFWVVLGVLGFWGNSQ